MYLGKNVNNANVFIINQNTVNTQKIDINYTEDLNTYTDVLDDKTERETTCKKYRSIPHEPRSMLIQSSVKKIIEIQGIGAENKLSYTQEKNINFGAENYISNAQDQEDRKSTRLNSSHRNTSRMPSSA